jgi:dienelactone hydrolase
MQQANCPRKSGTEDIRRHQDVRLCRPPSGSRAAFCCDRFAGSFGVSSHIRDVSEPFAREGYVAIAPELFHRTAPGFDGRYGDLASVVPHCESRDAGGRRAGLAG